MSTVARPVRPVDRYRDVDGHVWSESPSAYPVTLLGNAVNVQKP